MTAGRRALGARPGTEGFTLIELLVVIMIIAILATLSLGPIQNFLLRGELAKTTSNLKQIGAAIFSYAADNDGEFPPNSSGNPFTIKVRPYLGETNVGQSTLRGSVLYTRAQKTPYFVGTTNSGYALSYGMNGFIGITNNTVTTAGTRLSRVRQPSKLAMVMDFQDHYIVSSGTDLTNRVDAIRVRYGGQMGVVFADGHTESLPVDSVFPVNASAASASTNGFWLGN